MRLKKMAGTPLAWCHSERSSICASLARPYGPPVTNGLYGQGPVLGTGRGP